MAVLKVSPQVRDLVVDIPVVAQMQISWLFFETLQLLYFDLVVDVLVVLVVVGFCGAVRGAPVPQITGNSSFSATWKQSWCASATDHWEIVKFFGQVDEWYA